MNIQEIRKIAQAHGIKTGKLAKIDLIKHIQKEEGNFDCFASAVDGICDQTNCLWRQDCFDVAKKGLSS